MDLNKVWESIFQKILTRKIPWVILATSEHCFSILTNKQSIKWHSLIIPKRFENDFSDLSDEEIWEFCVMKDYVRKGLKLAFDPMGVWELVSGFEIDHIHTHLIPANYGNEVSIQNVGDVDMDERLRQWKLIKEQLQLLWPEHRWISFYLPTNI